jgi:hypothetical protein
MVTRKPGKAIVDGDRLVPPGQAVCYTGANCRIHATCRRAHIDEANPHALQSFVSKKPKQGGLVLKKRKKEKKEKEKEKTTHLLLWQQEIFVQLNRRRHHERLVLLRELRVA